MLTSPLRRLLRLGLPNGPSPEVETELRNLVAQLRRGAERRRLTVLLGGHRKAALQGCLLAALPTPLLADVVRAAVQLDTCRIEVDMTVSWADCRMFMQISHLNRSCRAVLAFHSDIAADAAVSGHCADSGTHTDEARCATSPCILCTLEYVHQ